MRPGYRVKRIVIRQLHEPRWKLVELYEPSECFVCNRPSNPVWLNHPIVVCTDCEEEKHFVKDEDERDGEVGERGGEMKRGLMLPRSRIRDSSIRHIVLVHLHEPQWKLVELYEPEECFICGRLSTFVWLNNPVVVCPECEEEKNFVKDEDETG